MSEKRHKRGEVRSDGMVFWAYQSKTTRSGDERWVTPEKFKSSIEAEKLRVSKLTIPTKERKRGEVRDDGMIFWAYAKGCKNGERWMTLENFQKKMESSRAADARRSKKKERMAWLNERAKKARRENPQKVRDQERASRIRRIDKIRNTARIYHAKKRKSDPVYLMKMRMYCRVYNAFRDKGIRKKTKTAQMLGCSFEKFKKHIESQFKDGMSWDNKGEWEVDHIIPVSCATTPEGLAKLFHYKNCRPAWASHNRSKGANLELTH